MALSIKARIDTKVLANVRQKLEQIKDPMRAKDAKALGAIVIAGMKDLISKGISPIAGMGRFPAYKNPRMGYPSTVRKEYPSKRNTPVNLYLSGDFIAALNAQVQTIGSAARTIVGYFDSKEAKKEKGHREGANTQPKRPTIPSGSETFAQRIQVEILKFTRETLDRIIKS